MAGTPAPLDVAVPVVVTVVPGEGVAGVAPVGVVGVEGAAGGADESRKIRRVVPVRYCRGTRRGSSSRFIWERILRFASSNASELTLRSTSKLRKPPPASTPRGTGASSLKRTNR